MLDAWKRIDERYGAYRSTQIAIKMAGSDGAEAIEGAMKDLRENPPAELANNQVKRMRDVQTGIAMDCATGASSQIALPKSNVLEFTLDDDSRILARPSGTEPKIKFYVEVVGKDAATAESRLVEVVNAVRKRTGL